MATAVQSMYEDFKKYILRLFIYNNNNYGVFVNIAMSTKKDHDLSQ